MAEVLIRDVPEAVLAVSMLCRPTQAVPVEFTSASGV